MFICNEKEKRCEVVSSFCIERRYKDDVAKRVNEIYSDTMKNVYNFGSTKRAEEKASERCDDYVKSCKDPYKFCLIVNGDKYAEFESEEFANKVFGEISNSLKDNQIIYTIPEELLSEIKKELKNNLIEIKIDMNILHYNGHNLDIKDNEIKDIIFLDNDIIRRILRYHRYCELAEPSVISPYFPYNITKSSLTSGIFNIGSYYDDLYKSFTDAMNAYKQIAEIKSINKDTMTAFVDYIPNDLISEEDFIRSIDEDKMILCPSIQPYPMMYGNKLDFSFICIEAHRD